MRKIFAQFLLICFLFGGFSPAVLAKESLPELPDLPVEFDTVLPPDGLDVFSPSTTPAQIAPQTPQPAVQTTPSKTSAPVKTQSAAAQNSTVKKQTTASPSQKPASGQTNTAKQTTSSQNKSTASTTTQQKPAQTQQKPAQTTQKVNTSNNSYYKNNTKSTYKVPKGKKFKVRLQQTISSNTPVGTQISFVSRYPETATYITIPSGTVFKGRITNSHKPQITGNGGLIVINVDRMVYNGKTYEIDAKVSIANEKRIFLNNIKGKRMYFQSIPKSIKPGANYFKKMWKVTKRLAKNESGVEIILTPFSFVAGTVVYVVNVVASPVLAIFYKGNSITIPKDSPFTIQLREDALIVK